MKNPKPFHKRIALILLAIFLPSLFPVNLLYASNNGPKAPEAASFEPVDATDMVNLLTGQYSYVLPLLNVPSPEGGYPIALSYHAGIALDQQASWTGLGWNLNPGAIERNINGYPDDYKSEYIADYFYDAGGEQTASYLSIGYSMGMASVGLGFNWGSHQALGGQVNLGTGINIGNGVGLGAAISVGTSGTSANLGATFYGGLTLGVNLSKEGVGINAGFNSNGGGFNIGYNSSKSYSLLISGGNNSTGFSLSATNSSINSSISGAGIGMSSSKLNSSISNNDISIQASNSNNNLIVPTPIGIFSMSFGSRKIKYELRKNKGIRLNGILYFNDNAWPNGITTGNQDIDYQFPQSQSMDIYEISINNNNLSQINDVQKNNPVFPSYDNYNIQAQGLSGTMNSTHFENGTLFGNFERNYNDEGYRVRYSNNLAYQSAPDYPKFDGKPYFYLNNEISSYLNANVSIPSLSNTIDKANMFLFYEGGADQFAKPRRKTSTFVEYYTNIEILNNSQNLKDQGYLENNASGFDRSKCVPEGIGSFKITTVDGKTYHYSLPVYNHEIVTRSFGQTNKPEYESHVEKFQLESYATHWLLTAITGPDFIDNGDGVAGEGDLGYWTSFEYGLWSDAFAWKAPYKKDYIIDEQNSNIKTWIKGRKQIYYLDKIKTRTHSALFIKSIRNDAKSEEWSFSSTNHIQSYNGSTVNDPYVHRFTIPSQNQLKLDKVLLLKNSDDTSSKTYGPDNNNFTYINYGSGMSTLEDWDATTYTKVPYNSPYEIYDNILDTNDNYLDVISKSIKTIDFNYDYSLVQQDNRLTLKQVEFKGKNNSSTLPPYKFEYYNSSTPFNIENQDGWGYLESLPKAYSLKEITTPIGGKININYEKNIFYSVTPVELNFSNKNTSKYLCNPIINSNSQVSQANIEVGFLQNYPIGLNHPVNVNFTLIYIHNNNDLSYLIKKSYVGSGYISQILDTNIGKYEVTFNGTSSDSVIDILPGYVQPFTNMDLKIDLQLNGSNVYQSGIRVSELNVTDGISSFKTQYKYGENEDGIGYVSYIPFAQNLAKELAYSSELPAPRVMYEYVTSNTKNSLDESLGKTLYRFNIMKEKSPNEIKFGDFYEISSSEQEIINYADAGQNSLLTGNKKVRLGNYIVKDNLNSIGQLLEVHTYNEKNHLLSKKINEYYNPTNEVIPDNIGVKQESYLNFKSLEYQDSNIMDNWIINSSTRITYPNILKSSTEQSNGYTYTTEFNDYDLISGVSKEQIHTSSDGKILKTKIVPAYLKYPGMGSKVDDINNANMLLQTAATYSYIQDNGVWKETGVGITTWNNEWVYQDLNGTPSDPNLETPKEKIWRKHKNYIWNGVTDSEGIFEGYNSATDDGFNWTVGVGTVQPNQWKQISEVTLYDHYSMPLEVQDINGNKAATKMDVFDEKVQATGNAGYNEMYYSGAEESIHNFYVGQEIRLPNAATTITSDFAHTGKYSVAATNATEFGVFMRINHRPTRYKITVWAHKNNYQKARLRWFDNNPENTFEFNGEKYFAGDWVQLNHYVDAAYMNLNNTAAYWYVNSIDNTTVHFDDLMIRPIASSITGYVYNKNDELTEIISNNGLATRFEYDKAGRLVKTYVEILDDTANGLTGGFKLSAKNKINYRK